MYHHVFRFATRGPCLNGKKLDGFEHNHIVCLKLQCDSIVVLLCTAIWWKSKDAVVHSLVLEIVNVITITLEIVMIQNKISKYVANKHQYISYSGLCMDTTEKYFIQIECVSLTNKTF